MVWMITPVFTMFIQILLIIAVINGGVSMGSETVITNGDGTGADTGGLSVDDQKDWAWTGAKECASARRNYTGKTGKFNINYAIGFLQVTFMSFPESYGPVLGIGQQSTHSEQVILDYWSKTRIPLLKSKLGDHLILLIFTRNNVCPPCRSMVPTWRTELAASADLGVIIHFYLWESVNPRMHIGPDNLRPAGVL